MRGPGDEQTATHNTWQQGPAQLRQLCRSSIYQSMEGSPKLVTSPPPLRKILPAREVL